MNRRNRTLVVLALLAVATAVAIVARAWWVLMAVAIGLGVGSLSGPVGRYYRRRSLLGRRVLLAAGMVLCLGAMALYVLGMAVPYVDGAASADGWGLLFWIVWALLMTPPVAVLVMLVRVWRRAGDPDAPAAT